MIERSRRSTDAFITDLDSGSPVASVLMRRGSELGTTGLSTARYEVS